MKEFKSSDLSGFRTKMLEALHKAVPGVKFRVENIDYRGAVARFDIRAELLEGKVTVADVAAVSDLARQSQGYELAGYDKTKKKPYVLRKGKRVIHAGEVPAQALFGRKGFRK